MSCAGMEFTISQFTCSHCPRENIDSAITPEARNNLRKKRQKGGYFIHDAVRDRPANDQQLALLGRSASGATDARKLVTRGVY